MMRFRSWTGGQLVVFSFVLAFVGLLLFLSYRTWDAQYRDRVENFHKSWQSAIDSCAGLTTERCNERVRPYVDAGMQGLMESARHNDTAAWFLLSVVVIDLVVIPGTVAYMAFQWFGAQRRANG